VLFAAKKPQSKKEQILERMKRVETCFEAAQILAEDRKKLYVARGGFMKPVEDFKVNDDWQDRVGSMRKSISSHRDRARSRGKSIFRSR